MATTEAAVLEEEQVDETEVMLPLCEANRSLVVDPTFYSANAVFKVGSLTFIDKAP